MCKKNNYKNKAFTLVELLISISLFTIISFISIGALITIFDANKRSQSSKTVVDNLNLSIEDMARTIRFGDTYHCGSSLPLDYPNDCSVGSNQLAVQFEGNTIVYRLNGTSLQRSNDGGSTYSTLTSSDVVITQLNFYVFGSSNLDVMQPYVVIVIRGYVGNRPINQSTFFIQTVASQRTLDAS